MARKHLVLMTALGTCLLITVLYVALQPYPTQLYLLSNTSESAFSFIPLFGSVYLLRKQGSLFPRSARYLAIGFLLWVMGELTYSAYALFLGVAIPYPSIADLFWLSGYPFILVGMVFIVLPFRSALTLVDWVVATIVTVLAAIVVGVVLILPVLAISPDVTSNIVGFAYPIFDISLFTASVFGFLLFRRGKVARTWYIFVLGAFLFSIADILFSFATAKGVYFDGDPLELLYEYGYVCFGLSLYGQLKAWELK